MAIETLAARTGATPLRIRRVQKITLTLLFIAGIVNFLDRSSLSVAGEAIRADWALAPPSSGCCSPPFRSPTASRNCPPVFCWIARGHGLCWAPG